MKPFEQRTLGTEQYCEVFHLSKKSLYDQINKGTVAVKPRRHRRKLLWDAEEVEQALKNLPVVGE